MKISALIVYRVTAEVDIDASLLDTAEGIETARSLLYDEADAILTDGGITPVVHEATDKRLVDWGIDPKAQTLSSHT